MAEPAREEAQRAFLKDAGWTRAALSPLPGDASTRRYVRVVQDGRNAMLMDQPQGAEAATAGPDATPAERYALGYNAVARLAGADTGRFVAAARYLKGRGLAAPEIYAADTGKGFVLIEDFGDGLYAAMMDSGTAEAPLYEAAIDALVTLHGEQAPPALAPGKPLFPYDDTAMLAETDLLTEWFLPLATGRETPPDVRDEHRALWRAALGGLPRFTPVFVHRDYHAQNLMWLPGRAGVARVGMIDFQDALAGHPAYDLISLLEDARREVSPAMSDFMTALYISRAHAAGLGIDESEFRGAAALLAAQRNAKIIGIFARLWLRDRKARYVAYLPRMWRYMQRDFAHPSLAPLRAWYDKNVPMDLRGEPRIGEGHA
jgi:aminoglycoside/choline kinase family phosphotransferase